MSYFHLQVFNDIEMVQNEDVNDSHQEQPSEDTEELQEVVQYTSPVKSKSPNKISVSLEEPEAEVEMVSVQYSLTDKSNLVEEPVDQEEITCANEEKEDAEVGGQQKDANEKKSDTELDKEKLEMEVDEVKKDTEMGVEKKKKAATNEGTVENETEKDDQKQVKQIFFSI